ncbi:MAG: TolC family protein [Paludisphaera borealis]|uniref:TolC family protein n=1 Tax=Paludisphaera borealis TaxID=1387353 RepID=UPI00284CA17D|nr:TolC family protein [Paludisphaera borealis]MDR3619526.1 TolC family protein [Paludisphaera borealis]
MKSTVPKSSAAAPRPRPAPALLATLAILVLVGVPARLRAQPAASPPPPSPSVGEEAEKQPSRPPGEEAEADPSSTAPAPPAPPSVPLSLDDAIRQSLANVDTVQANVATQRATVARFEALKAFIPLVNLPQLQVAFNQLGGPGKVMILPDVTGGALLEGSPGLQQAALNRANLYFPMAPSGHITALPIAEEGIHAKVLMEQLVRRSQMILAIQGYYTAKQIDYGIRTARLGVALTGETVALTKRKLNQQQVHDVELTEVEVNDRKARVLLSELEKESRITQRELALVLHQSRLLVPQQKENIPVKLDYAYGFDLAEPDEVDLRWMPDFPGSRDEAVQLAKQQRVDVRIRVVGLRIARLQQKKSVLGLFGEGQLPAELGFKNTSPAKNGGITLGAIFGSSYGLPVVDVGLWSGIREARLDVVLSQLELEKSLIEVAADAGNSWDRWQQSIREWELSEAELALRHELLERMERMYEQKQAIWLEVLGTRVNLLQADANRWTQWYNLQLARFNVLRSTEQLLDYVERKRIARLTAWQKPPPEGNHRRWLPWLASKESQRTPGVPKEGRDGRP